MIREAYSCVKDVTIGLKDIFGCLGDILKKRIFEKGFIVGILRIIFLMTLPIGGLMMFIDVFSKPLCVIIGGFMLGISPFVTDMVLDVISEYKLPLIKFSYVGNLTMVKLLLKLGFDPNKSSNMNTPLLATIKSKNMNIEKKIRMLNLLLDNGAYIDELVSIDNNSVGTALVEACREGYLDIVKFLVEKGANINCEEEGSTSLEVACREGHLDIVKFLVEKGANINCKEEGSTSLEVACREGHLDIVKFLVEKGANINCKEEGSINLEIACSAGHLDIVKFLVEKGADYRREYYLVKACKNKHYDVARYLVDIGIDFKFDDIPVLFGNMNHVESEMLCAICDGNESRLSNLIKSYTIEKDSSLFLRMLEKHVLSGVVERCTDLKNMIQKREDRYCTNSKYATPDNTLSLLKNRSNKWNSTKAQIDTFIKTTKDILTNKKKSAGVGKEV